MDRAAVLYRDIPAYAFKLFITQSCIKRGHRHRNELIFYFVPGSTLEIYRWGLDKSNVHNPDSQLRPTDATMITLEADPEKSIDHVGEGFILRLVLDEKNTKRLRDLASSIHRKMAVDLRVSTQLDGINRIAQLEVCLCELDQGESKGLVRSTRTAQFFFDTLVCDDRLAQVMKMIEFLRSTVISAHTKDEVLNLPLSYDELKSSPLARLGATSNDPHKKQEVLITSKDGRDVYIIEASSLQGDPVKKVEALKKCPKPCNIQFECALDVRRSRKFYGGFWKGKEEVTIRIIEPSYIVLKSVAPIALVDLQECTIHRIE